MGSAEINLSGFSYTGFGMSKSGLRCGSPNCKSNKKLGPVCSEMETTCSACETKLLNTKFYLSKMFYFLSTQLQVSHKYTVVNHSL